MSNETNIIPLVDILSEQLGERVVMNGNEYVLLGDNSEVAQSEVNVALTTQKEQQIAVKKQAHYDEWKAEKEAKAEARLYKNYQIEMADEIARII